LGTKQGLNFYLASHSQKLEVETSNPTVELTLKFWKASFRGSKKMIGNDQAKSFLFFYIFSQKQNQYDISGNEYNTNILVTSKIIVVDKKILHLYP